MEIKQEFFQKLLDCKWLESCGSDGLTRIT